MSDFNEQVTELFSETLSAHRMPHAILITGGTPNLRDETVRFLSTAAVCSESNRPCGNCKHCIKALSGGHSDIYTPKLTGKTNTVSIDAIRELIRDASIIPNEADTKVFIIKDIDKSMSELVQNSFLKILEEPPLSTLFVLTAESTNRLLPTILSRVQVFSLKQEYSVNEEINEIAKEIIDGIISPGEIKLLYATARLNTRPIFKEVLTVVSEYLRLGLNRSVGVKNDNEQACAIAKKLTKSRIIELIDLTQKAIIRADRNVNMALLCTWLCGEYRRISWQR